MIDSNYIYYGLTLLISATALIISIKAWYKSRVFYDIEIYQIIGNSGDINLKQIKKQLNTGKYTIINTYVEEHSNNKNNYLFILIGKIKK